jgi:hypothetical protein
MLTSIDQVNEQFFRMFYGLNIIRRGVTVPVHLRYARKSAEDYTEEDYQQLYPCIAIQDHSPNLKTEWFIDMKSYGGGLSMDELKVFIFRRPVWMEFMFDVSIAAKSYLDITALKNLFVQKFGTEVSFLFNKKLEGDDAVGDVVPFTIRTTDIPRTDGVIEVNYEFTLAAWLYLVEGIEQDTSEYVINLVQKGLE